MQKFLIFILFLISATTQDSTRPHVILRQGETEPFTFYQVSMDGAAQPLADFAPPSPTPTPNADAARVGIYEMTGNLVAPLYGPFAVHDIPPIYTMSGEDTPSVNLYVIQNREFIQITDVLTLFPEAQAPILSASSELIAFQNDTILYRARLRDATGTDFNGLYLYDLATETTLEMPFFGKNPVFSPDGALLAGSRLGETSPPLYELWVVDLATGEEQLIANACNPQFSPDGAWLAYDLHDNAQWQGYTDCFANGQVEAVNLATQQKILLSAGLTGYLQLEQWELD